LGELRPDLDPTTIHRGRRGEEELGRRPSLPENDDGKLQPGRPPETGKDPKLLLVQGDRPSLSPSLWPAELPEERERGAGGSTPRRGLSRESKGGRWEKGSVPMKNYKLGLSSSQLGLEDKSLEL
jgi:hypothetical protein